MSAAFKFNQYRIVKLNYEPNLIEGNNNVEDSNDVKNENSTEYNITISNFVSVNAEDPHKYRSELHVEVSGSASASVVLYGYFEGTDFYKEEYDRESSEISPISTNILLPIARSILASISCQDGSKPILIPVVNINEMKTADEA